MQYYNCLNIMRISNSLCFRKTLLTILPLLRWEINKYYVKTSNEVREALENVSTKKKIPSARSYLIPPLNKNYINEIKTITVVSVGYWNFTWISLALDTLNVLDWNGKQLPQNFTTELHEPSLLSFAYNIKKSLPESDLYAMETFSMNIKHWERKVNEIRLLSMLIVLIHGLEADQEYKTKVVFQEKRVLDKVFPICLGYDRVTTADITESILEEVNALNCKPSNITIENFNSALQISSKLINFFKSVKSEKKEDLSLVFLLAISIIQVHIYKIKSIHLLKNKKKK